MFVFVHPKDRHSFFSMGNALSFFKLKCFNFNPILSTSFFPKKICLQQALNRHFNCFVYPYCWSLRYDNSRWSKTPNHSLVFILMAGKNVMAWQGGVITCIPSFLRIGPNLSSEFCFVLRPTANKKLIQCQRLQALPAALVIIFHIPRSQTKQSSSVIGLRF